MYYVSIVMSLCVLMLCCSCQIDISKAQIHNTFTTGEDIIIIPDAPRKREELITRLKDTKRPTKLEILLQNQHIQIHTQIRQQRDVSVQSEHYQTILKEQYNNLVYPNQQLLYILPSSICNVAISVEFVCLCLNPISNLLMLGDVGVSSNRVNENGGSSQFSLNYSNHGTKSMEMKLEALLLGNAHGSGGKNHANGNSDVNRDSNEPILPTVPSLLSEFEAAINYEIHKYQEHLLEDISQEQANQLRSIDYQLYCKDSDTK